MSSNSADDDAKELAAGDEQSNNNPFVAFKHVVDTALRALPSSTWLRSAWKDVERDLTRLTCDERQDACECSSSLDHEARQRNAHVPPPTTQALASDPDANMAYMDLLSRNTRHTDALSGSMLEALASPPRWLSVDWFAHSPYSPIRLEAHSESHRSRQRWRAAFEDLMSASVDRPMQSHHDMYQVGMRLPFGKSQSLRHAPGLDWMLSLQCHGIPPPVFPPFWRDKHSRSTVLDHLEASAPISFGAEDWIQEGQLSRETSFSREVSDMLKEIATSATSETDATATCASVVQPATEQDLYDSLDTHGYGMGRELTYVDRLAQDKAILMDMESRNKRRLWEHDSSHAREKHGQQFEHRDDCQGVKSASERWLSSGHREMDRWDAVHSRDVSTAAHVLAGWHGRYGDVEELLGTASAARSDQDLKQRKELAEETGELAGDPVHWTKSGSLSNTELDDTVEALRRQRYSLQLSQWQPAREYDESTTSLSSLGKPARVIHPPDCIAKRPDVLSALTTTHTTRSPDGTVTTKVVLKQRFSDGREETTESLHTANGKAEYQQQGEEQPKKTGWFWSSGKDSCL